MLNKKTLLLFVEVRIKKQTFDLITFKAMLEGET